MPHSIVAIIPLYNGQEFIEGAISSVLAQTRQPDEFVVVDDGSTDEGPAIVQRIASHNPKLRYLRKENGGQSSARNFGAKNSSSTLIALLDQDDIWYADHLLRLSEPFDADAVLGWAYSNLDEIDRDGFMVRRGLLDHLGSDHPKTNLYTCLDRDMYILPSASLISRAAFNDIGGFDERLVGYEDDDLFLRLFRRGYRNEYLVAALSQWRIYPGSTSGSLRMGRSRAVYAQKLMQMVEDSSQYPAAARSGPARRFSANFLADIHRSLREGRKDLHGAAKSNLGSLLPHLPWARRLYTRVALLILGSYPIARLLHLAGLLRVGRFLARGGKLR